MRRQHDRQIPGRFGEPHAADDIREHVLPLQRKSRMTVCDREQHRQTISIDADRDAARIGAETRVREHLDLEQQATRALAHDRNDAARYRLAMPREKDRGRVRHLAQALFDHREHADLIGGPESILDRAQHAEAAAGIAFKIQHRVDHVFEYAWPGDLPLLGDMADQQNCGSAALGEAHEFGSRLSELCHRARRRFDALRIHRLNGIDDENSRAHRGRCGDDFLDTGLGDQARGRCLETQPACAQGHLLQRFLAGRVQHGSRGVERGCRLQHQRGFTDARITAQ